MIPYIRTYLCTHLRMWWIEKEEHVLTIFPCCKGTQSPHTTWYQHTYASTHIHMHTLEDVVNWESTLHMHTCGELRRRACINNLSWLQRCSKSPHMISTYVRIYTHTHTHAHTWGRGELRKKTCKLSPTHAHTWGRGELRKKTCKLSPTQRNTIPSRVSTMDQGKLRGLWGDACPEWHHDLD